MFSFEERNSVVYVRVPSALVRWLLYICLGDLRLKCASIFQPQVDSFRAVGELNSVSSYLEAMRAQ